MTSSTKPEVHNVSQRRQSRTEPQPWITCAENLAKVGRVVEVLHRYACGDIDIKTDRHTHHNTPLPILRRSEYI